MDSQYLQTNIEGKRGQWYQENDDIFGLFKNALHIK